MARVEAFQQINQPGEFSSVLTRSTFGIVRTLIAFAVFFQSFSPIFAQVERFGATPQVARAMASEIAASQFLLSKQDSEMRAALAQLRSARQQVAALKARAGTTRTELDTALLREQAALLLVDKLAQERRAVDQQFSLFYNAVFKTVKDAADLGSPELRSALTLYQSGDRDRAIYVLSEVLNGDDQKSRTIGARTLALLAVERVEEGGVGIERGVGLLEAALRVDPDFNAGWVVLRIYYSQTGQWSRAIYAQSQAEKSATTPDERTAVLAAKADLAGFLDRPETGKLWDEAVAAFKARAIRPDADSLSWISYFDTIELAASYAIHVSHDVDKGSQLLDEGERALGFFPEQSLVPERKVTVAALRAKIAFAKSRFDDALGFSGEALKIARRLVARTPSNEKFQGAVVEALVIRGDTLATMKSIPEANDAFAEAYEITKRQLAIDVDDGAKQFAIENVLATWGQIPQEQQSQIWIDLRGYIERFGAKRPLMDPEKMLLASSRRISP